MRCKQGGRPESRYNASGVQKEAGQLDLPGPLCKGEANPLRMTEELFIVLPRVSILWGEQKGKEATC
jgi:hypothetical protein